MSFIKRRQFLQFAGSTLATLGWSQLDVMRQGDRYGQVLAQSTSRKLALLVGINEYPNSQRFSTLKGCVTDLELQKQLLVHRFGFNPKDILVVTDKKATRQGILTAFEEHLIKQAKQGDVVVFHYSGHGSRIIDPNPIGTQKLNGTFVPSDDESAATEGTVNDIMGRTLFLLMRALQTDYVTAVLDSCHSGAAQRGVGERRIRAARGSGDPQINIKPSSVELEYQNQWLKKLGLTPQQFKELRDRSIAKGIVISSTMPEEEAADAPYDGFTAGAFTYAMTQYLWQATSQTSFANAFVQFSPLVTRSSFTRQRPEISTNPENNRGLPFYFCKQTIAPPAEAVITEVKGNQATIWLGGLDQNTLNAFEKGAALQVISSSRGGAKVRLQSRDGLTATAIVEGSVTPGALLQEEIRGIPSNLKLNIGLDSSLGKDAAIASQNLSKISSLQAVPTQSIPDTEVQYLLGRMTANRRNSLSRLGVKELPPEGSVGLFVSNKEIIPGSFGSAGEAVASAVERLRPKFKSLLAARLVKLMLNGSTSRLKLAVSVHPEGQPNSLFGSAFTVRSGSANPGTPNKTQVPLKTPLQFRVTNQETTPLYVTLLVINQNGEMSAVFPNAWVGSEADTQVQPGTTLLIPNPETDPFQLTAIEPKGMTEVLVLASRTPLAEALKALRQIASRGKTTRGPVDLSEQEDPINVVDGLLADFNQSSRDRGAVQGVNKTDTTQMVAMSITFEVV